MNLSLARIAAETGGTNQALRYYHNAIYATWPGDGEEQRRAARVELIEYLLKINAKAQAQAELMALAANLGDESAEQAHLGDLFLRSQDYQHALSAYQTTLKSDRRDRAALAGAGLAAYETGQYPLAQKYLQAAVSGRNWRTPRRRSDARELRITSWPAKVPVICLCDTAGFATERPLVYGKRQGIIQPASASNIPIPRANPAQRCGARCVEDDPSRRTPERSSDDYHTRDRSSEYGNGVFDFPA